ncbi:hypothetical protein [Amycolatopsis sp. cmx-11-12]|uniref:hypothetical protein n=1 Tax=Amycolatopsis sp. cmx-11-12 TaxID=2785795 RepID=UPI003917DC36
MSGEPDQPSIHIGGDVHGQNVLVGSTQTVHGDFTITVGGATDSEELLAQLRAQTEALAAALREVPADCQGDAEDVHAAAEDAVAEVAKDEVAPAQVRRRAATLRRAAERLASVTPSVLAFATQVAATIEKFA